jgi:hypothetical protein
MLDGAPPFQPATGSHASDSAKTICSMGAVTNVDWKVLINERLPESERRLNVAYIPVT